MIIDSGAVDHDANHILGTNMIIMAWTASCINNGQHPVIFPDTKLSYNKATDREKTHHLYREEKGWLSLVIWPLHCGISVTNNVQCLNVSIPRVISSHPPATVAGGSRGIILGTNKNSELHGPDADPGECQNRC